MFESLSTLNSFNIISGLAGLRIRVCCLSPTVTLESLSSLMDMNVIVKNKGYECDGLSRGHKLKAKKEMMC